MKIKCSECWQNFEAIERNSYNPLGLVEYFVPEHTYTSTWNNQVRCGRSLMTITDEERKLKTIKRTKVVKRFGDMSYGTHFKELGKGRNARKFIKIQDVLPSGLNQKCGRIIQNEDGTWSELNEQNALDYDGIFGRCPQWLEFEVIKEGKYKTRSKEAVGEIFDY